MLFGPSESVTADLALRQLARSPSSADSVSQKGQAKVCVGQSYDHEEGESSNLERASSQTLSLTPLRTV